MNESSCTESLSISTSDMFESKTIDILTPNFNFPMVWNDCALGLLLVEFNLGEFTKQNKTESKKLVISTGSDTEKILYLL
jgi:hypothetical protein